MTTNVIGTLRNARRVNPGEDPRAPCLSGDVYGDTKGRFSDGERITTSTIFEELPDGVFKTRFSAYRVESWADAKPANDNFSTLRAANRARQKEWDAGNQITLAYRGNELAGEVGEACNVIKKLERERLGIAGSRDTLEHLAEELADVIICVDLVAMGAGVVPDPAEFGVDTVFLKHKLLLANHMTGACGRVCETASLPFHSTRVLSAQLSALVATTQAIATAYGIDLDAAVRAKFNATSAKVGLRTRLVAA